MRPYLKGKTLFFISLIVISLSTLLVFLTGLASDRSITENFVYTSYIVGCSTLLFITIGLYLGVGIKDNYKGIGRLKLGEYTPLSDAGSLSLDTPTIDAGDGIGGIIVSILLWIVLAIIVIALLILFEALIWASWAILLAMLYWIFIRAMRIVFVKSRITKGNLKQSIFYGLYYSIAYVGWIIGIAVAMDLLKTFNE